jgi:cobyrinic acid a,c-diamide synthase
VFAYGSSSSDVAVVEGTFDAAAETATGSSLDELCLRLEAPPIAVVDATRLGACESGPLLCRPPVHELAGVLLDRVADAEEACRLRVLLEALWGVPVLGMLEELPALRTIVSRLRPGQSPSKELCRILGDRLRLWLPLERLLGIASASKLPPIPPRLFQFGEEVAGLRVAVAIDEAVGCYFPDTLDLLELRGAILRDFSPLRSDRLPEDVDVVYIGCGHPEEHAAALAGNHCLRESLRDFARGGGRFYAEGGGLAYLCREVRLQDGRRFPMAGLLPAVACENRHAATPRPVEVTLAYDTWLGESATTLRGYLNTAWRIEPAFPLASCALEPERSADFFCYGRIIGSRVHIHFAAQEEFLRRFFQPHPTALAAVL